MGVYLGDMYHARLGRLLAITLLGAVAACSEGNRNPENTMRCAIQAMGAANHVLERFQLGTTVMDHPPTGLRDTVPARVVGHGTARALVAPNPEGIVAGYEGEGFPTRPGFAVALVDDSTEVFRGILIFETDGPANYPQIGTISSATTTLPLYAMRAPWSVVSTDQCPLFRVTADSGR